jgi:hypothetical protein
MKVTIHHIVADPETPEELVSGTNTTISTASRRKKDGDEEQETMPAAMEDLVAMKQREDKFYKFESFVCRKEDATSPPPCSISGFERGMLPEAWRRELCDWISSCAVSFELNDQDPADQASSSSSSSSTSSASGTTNSGAATSRVEALALSFMDRFLASLPYRARGKSKTCQVVALAAMHLAHCFASGSRYMSLPFKTLLTLVDSGSSITSEDLEHAHSAMLRGLRFMLHPPVAQEYLHYFKTLLCDFRHTGTSSSSYCLKPSECDFLEMQTNLMTELALKESALVPIPKHTVAFVALAVIMEYTFPIPTNVEASFCKAFLRHLSQQHMLDLNVSSYFEGASGWEAATTNTTTCAPIGTQQQGHDTRIARTLLWKLVLEQPSVAAKLETLVLSVDHVDLNQESTTTTSEQCSSPHSVACAPLVQDGADASTKKVLAKAPSASFHDDDGFNMEHLLWWESYIEDCKAHINPDYHITPPAAATSCFGHHEQAKLPADLFVPDLESNDDDSLALASASVPRKDSNAAVPSKTNANTNAASYFASASRATTLAPRRTKEQAPAGAAADVYSTTMALSSSSHHDGLIMMPPGGSNHHHEVMVNNKKRRNDHDHDGTQHNTRHHDQNMTKKRGKTSSRSSTLQPRHQQTRI